MKNDAVLRQELVALLRGGNAHMGFRDAVAGFPLKEINRALPNASYTVWHLLEHMRIAQWDILEFVRNPRHVSPAFPEEFWPKPGETASVTQWRQTIKEFGTDLEGFEELVNNPKTDFFGPIPHARDYTIFREVLLAADHNAYHVAEIVTIRRLLGLKPIREY